MTRLPLLRRFNPHKSGRQQHQLAGKSGRNSVRRDFIRSLPPHLPVADDWWCELHQSITVNWAASPGANFYTVYRSILFNNGGGASNVLGTIVLNNTNTTASFVDTTPTDGSIYSYFVTATSAGGTSGNSIAAVGVALPAPPATAPGSLTGNFVSANIVLHWSAVPGAVGCIIRRSSQ